MAFTYPPTGGSGTTSGKSIQLITDAPAGWYGPIGDTNSNTNYWDKNFVTLQPVSFSKDFSFTDWGVVCRDWSSAGATFVANGGRIETALYNSDPNTFAPTTLNSQLGYVDNNGTDPSPGGSPIYVLTKTLATPITLEANKVYWIAVRTAVKDGAGGYTSDTALNTQILKSVNSGVSISHPTDSNAFGYSSNNKAVIYDDSNSSLSVGSWASSHVGLAPFVSLASADMVYVTQGVAVQVKGTPA